MAPKSLRWAELKLRDDDPYADAGITDWGNKDLYPVLEEEKTFGWFAFLGFMTCSGVCVSNYSLGSSYIAVGLTAAETIGSILAGSFIAGCLTFIAARPGLDHGIGYTMCCRSVFGLRGQWIMVFFLSIAGVVFSGLQCYYGGQAVALMLSAMIPQYAFMENTLPASAGITTKDLIGFLLFYTLYIPVMWFIRPPQFRKLLYPGFFLVLVVMFGLLVYGMRSNGGSVGPLMGSNPIELSESDKAFRIAQCIFTVIGTWGGSAERFSDWSRFSTSRNAPSISLFIGMPLGITFSAIIGCLVTSATYGSTGVVQWNALTLLSELQEGQYTAKVRAATFFAGAALFLCQVIVNCCNNTVGWGMDMAGAFPRYFSMRRAAVLLAILSIIVQPWRFLTQATVFLQVLSVTSVFFSCSSWIMLCDYFLIRKRKLVIPDLFIGNDKSIYWFYKGFHWRSVIALLSAMWIAIPGLAYSIIGETNNWTRIFQINYAVGAPIACIVYLIFCFGISKPGGLGVQENMEQSGSVVVKAAAEEPGSADRDLSQKGGAIQTTIRTDEESV